MEGCVLAAAEAPETKDCGHRRRVQDAVPDTGVGKGKDVARLGREKRRFEVEELHFEEAHENAAEQTHHEGEEQLGLVEETLVPAQKVVQQPHGWDDGQRCGDGGVPLHVGADGAPVERLRAGDGFLPRPPVARAWSPAWS